jgi:hypothetical protein
MADCRGCISIEAFLAGPQNRPSERLPTENGYECFSVKISELIVWQKRDYCQALILGFFGMLISHDLSG